MGNSWSKNRKKACVAVCLLSTVPATTAQWQYWFGNWGCWDGAASGPDCCIFSGDSAGALTRTGECTSASGDVNLNNMGITSISAGVFANMGQLQ